MSEDSKLTDTNVRKQADAPINPLMVTYDL